MPFLDALLRYFAAVLVGTCGTDTECEQAERVALSLGYTLEQIAPEIRAIRYEVEHHHYYGGDN